MILSVSRRTDIPSYYSNWFYNRIRAGFVYVRNPMNFRQVGKVEIRPELVDCIVFWTKNPAPMLDRLDELNAYRYYFQYTLTAYGKNVETEVPVKIPDGIATFQRLAARIGRERVIWRYDPILLNEQYTVAYHTDYFLRLAEKLQGYTEKCTISFIDSYRNITSNLKALHMEAVTAEKKRALAGDLVKIAKLYGLQMDACAEAMGFEDLGIEHGRCIDSRLIERISGAKINPAKDKNQRPACGCAASIDIGAYNTCLNGCKYCYANHSIKAVNKNFARHEENSPLLCGVPAAEDCVKNRLVKSLQQS